MKKLLVVLMMVVVCLGAWGQLDTNNIGVKEWHWNTVRCTDGGLVNVDFIITNNTSSKLVHSVFEVIMWGDSERSIVMDDNKVLGRVKVNAFSDNGYDFVPANGTKKSGISVAIKRYALSSIKAVTFTLLSYDKVEMTFVDKALENVDKNIKTYEKNSNKNAPDQWYEVQLNLLKQKEALKVGK